MQYVRGIPRGEYTSLGDLPDGIFWGTTDAVVQQATQDWPDGISQSGEIITFIFKSGNYGIQFMIQSYGWLCIRNLNTTWQAWRKIQLT